MADGVIRARLLLLFATVSALPAAGPDAIAAPSGTVHVEMARQPLARALMELGRAAGQNVLFAPDVVGQRQAPAVKGDYTLKDAARRLLAGSGLTLRATPAGGLMIGRGDAARAASVPARRARVVREDIVATGQRMTRSVMSVGGEQIQDLMPGQNPMQALSILPGVIFTDVDPWGNNEQNASMYVHGFSTTQLGYTLDGVPLGAGAYGNYNGLSSQRAAISEDIASVSLSSGTGALGTASTSNLGGTIAFKTSAPAMRAGAILKQTFGSFATFRTFARVDTGRFGDGNAAYFAFARQDARPWNLGPANRQGGYQVNGKFVHEGEKTRVAAYFDWQDKVEPNTQGLSINTNDWLDNPAKAYTRGAFYPDLGAAMANYPARSSTQASPSAPNNQYYFSAAQRTDYLTYLNISHQFSDQVRWDNTLYYHHDRGAGLVATSIRSAAILTILGAYLDPTASQYIRNGQFTYANNGIDPVVWNRTGGTGFAVRTTEYNDNRGGITSTVHYRAGRHDVEAGIWYERNDNAQGRFWYPLSATDTLSPYDMPKNPLITQFVNVFHTDTFVYHMQDTYHVLPHLRLMAGMKLEHVNTNGTLPVASLPQAQSSATEGAVTLNARTNTVAGGTLSSFRPFLPAVGAVWDFTRYEEMFFNIQKNMNSYAEDGYGGASPWGVSSQQDFEAFRKNGHPETSWTYEVGIRTARPLDAGILRAISGQIAYYHVDFANRIGRITPPDAGISGVGSTVANLGSVTTDGVDAAWSVRLGEHVSLYDAVSYIRSVYDKDFTSGTTLYRIRGDNVAGIPQWSDKFVLRYGYGGFQAELNGEWMDIRHGTYTNQLYAPARFTMGFNTKYTFHDIPRVSALTLQFNIYNLTDARTWSSLSPGDSTSYTAYPMTPRTFYGTVSVAF
ncbi:TonB-dependent receptor plug domain-containing protein [Gluconacetobacter sp. Hr-1-5]|uniref:TonB-dependent receptor n=1 Tax=Gluconacetobacter sp. Hr-1-5 TaxID=3395370 RepID=UPI003B52F233